LLTSSATSGLGVAAVGAVPGFATERVMREIEDVSKSLLAVSEPPPTLTILEPVSGQHVAGDSVWVVVNAVGAAEDLRATCPQENARPGDVVRARDAKDTLSVPPNPHLRMRPSNATHSR
jgi:hypothetical protein